MFKFLKQIFAKEEQSVEVRTEEVQDWFNNITSKENHDSYFARIEEIKKELITNVNSLKEQNVSEKDAKQVEARVQNIVLGHKAKYCQEVERFAEKLVPTQKAPEFNVILDKEIQELAVKTSKSYQAVQHLFFKQVEPVYKMIGELNLLAKNFDTTKAEKLQQMQTIITSIHEGIQSKKDIESWIVDKKNKIGLLEENQKEQVSNVSQLKESAELKEYELLVEKKNEIEESLAKIENEIFSFFAKLQKPLKRYERVALNEGPIAQYIENSVEALPNDSDLEILEVLNNLKNNLDFDEKQKNKFIELIENNNLTQIQIEQKELNAKKQSIAKEIEGMDITNTIANAERKVSEVIHKIEYENKELEDLQSKLTKVDSEDNKKEFCLLVKEVFGITFSFSS